MDALSGLTQSAHAVSHHGVWLVAAFATGLLSGWLATRTDRDGAAESDAGDAA